MDEEEAYKLTQHFSAGSRVQGSKTNAYFDPNAEDILSSYVFAAAMGGLPVAQHLRLYADTGTSVWWREPKKPTAGSVTHVRKLPRNTMLTHSWGI